MFAILGLNFLGALSQSNFAEIDNRVVGGYDAKESRNFYVAVDEIGVCGGALFKPYFVVTAAHCVYGLENVEVYVGDFQEGTDELESVIGRVTIHPDYIHENPLTPDLAVIKLLQPYTHANDPSYVLPLCSSADIIPTSSEVGFCGMGTMDAYDEDDLPEVLQEVMLKQAPKSNSCGEAIINPEIQFCLQGNNKSPCDGDSGGPAYPFENNKPRCIYGVESWSNCEDSSVYGSVPFFYSWIMGVKE